MIDWGSRNLAFFGVIRGVGYPLPQLSTVLGNGASPAAALILIVSFEPLHDSQSQYSIAHETRRWHTQEAVGYH